MDSKMGALEIIRKTDSNTGHWSGFVKHLDRIIYKPELPFYPEYVQEEEVEEERSQAPKRETREPQKPRSTPEPKTSLGKMLGGFKVEE
jgi:3'-5' exoribonuclease